MGLINNYNDHNNDVTFNSMYNISDIVHTHRLLLTCNYEICTLYSIAHYSRTYFFFKSEVKFHFLCMPYTRKFLRNGQI